MKKNLGSFGTALSRDEAKKVIGGNQEAVSEIGGNHNFACQCVGTGTWTGSYPDLAAAQADLEIYCPLGGGCRAI